MSDNKVVDDSLEKDQLGPTETNIAASIQCEVSSITESAKNTKVHQRVTSSSERLLKFERAQKCLENAALVSKRIKEHRKATAELLGKPFEEDDPGDSASEITSKMSERTGYSITSDTSTTLSVQEALNIPGISESLANTLKQKELLMERIKQYKEISKRPIVKQSTVRKDTAVDPKSITRKVSSENTNVTQLHSVLKDKENSLSILQVKVKALETTILELQEKINEKDQIIEAKNKATALMSDSLSKKEKDSYSLLEDTRQQMTKMQENFISMEIDWKAEKEHLIKELEEKNEKISSLEEANTILENSRFEISIAHSKLIEELELKDRTILKLQEKIDTLSKQQQEQDSEQHHEEKVSLEISCMAELIKKVELLEQLNCQIRQANKELEIKLGNLNSESKSSATSSPSKKPSPLPARKGGRNTASKSKSPWSNITSEAQDSDKKPNKNELNKLELMIQSLNKDLLAKEYIIAEKDEIVSKLELAIAKKNNELENYKYKTPSSDLVDIGICTDSVKTIPTKDVEIMVISENIKQMTDEDSIHDTKEFEEKLKVAQDQILALNNEIEAANKNMIKVKSSNKLKLKQMQKTIENFSKVSDTNAEVIRLNEEIHQLSQKVAELEEEKGNLQLHLVDYDSGRLTESDVYKKLLDMEALAENRLKAISVLEAQKFELVQELHAAQQKNIELEDKLADISQLQSEQVSSEMKAVQLEEQIDELQATVKEFELVIENLKLDKEQSNGSIKELKEEKEELNQKLEHYIQENIDLTDKLEKLSAEKVSSAESIEIVESLTTQEKLELEEYNKHLTDSKIHEGAVDKQNQEKETLNKLVEDSVELNRKIELFTEERQEVLEKMNKINAENELLQKNINQLTNESAALHNTIEVLSSEKSELQFLNEELNRQIEDLKRERLDVMKSSLELSKPASLEEPIEVPIETTSEEKSSGDKNTKGAKSVKQLTKEILKLKNVIKEREDEIADCQMKILSLEEQHQKQCDLLQSNKTYESKIKSLLEENSKLKMELETALKDVDTQHQELQLKQANEWLQQELQRIQQEYSVTVHARDSRIQELEILLAEYEKQIMNYANSMQQKDKELNDYVNQITKLNDVSQKLRSTIEVLEEEKAKDQNADLIKSLNKQIIAYQKRLVEFEEKIRMLEEEKSQLLSLKASFENKNINLETETKKLQDMLADKQNAIIELQVQQQKYAEDMSVLKLEAKQRDEEIHEIKLQLRKESIENEKLRTSLVEKEKGSEYNSQELVSLKQTVSNLLVEKDQLNTQFTATETKNKELLEKLKKFAVNLKKKNGMYIELEGQLSETQKQIELKNEQIEQLLIQVDTLPALQEKLKIAEEEVNRLQSQKKSLEQQKNSDMQSLLEEIGLLRQEKNTCAENISNLTNIIGDLNNKLAVVNEENSSLRAQLVTVNNKLSDYELEQKNNTNFITSLEAEIKQKQTQIAEMLVKLENNEQQISQVQYGLDAKVQEREMYIENLESEINKYKSRIFRLEESISVMEDRRYSLERKADQLDTQLQEKQKAYTEYSNQEDELVARLAVLIDHDRVVEKQLHEIEHENKELQYKAHLLNEENQKLKKQLLEIQASRKDIQEKAMKAENFESECLKYQSQVQELQSHLKRLSQDHHSLITKKTEEIEELETEFNTQIENAIKEKKVLSEKYEKLNEHVRELDQKVFEYKNVIQNHNINIEELHRVNQELIQKCNNKDQAVSQDYTEQYIGEINRLNSIINAKNEEISNYCNQFQLLKTDKLSLIQKMDDNISKLNSSEKLIAELQTLLNQKEEHLKELKEKKTVSFEMNIPKTEGMVISSTFEAISEEPKVIDVSSLESQILSGSVHSDSEDKNKPTQTSSKTEVVEPLIVPKKTYLCYKGDDSNPVSEMDPFNSDEGWGFGEPVEEIQETTPNILFLNNKIQTLENENSKLKKDLEITSTKLLKAFKKLKELKANNEVLNKELNISKQLSQSTLLDTAIEDELKSNIKELEKKLEDLNKEIIKEKKEKEALRKQNEVFNNANERLTEMKEKMDNELELWKFKFKEANDKISAFEWGAESKSTPEHKPSQPCESDNSLLKEEIIKLEKENDELQSTIDQLRAQNNELTSMQDNLKVQLENLNIQIQQQSVCKNCDVLNNQIVSLKRELQDALDNNTELVFSSNKVNELENNYENLKHSCELLKTENENLKFIIDNHQESVNKYTQMKQENDNLRTKESELKNKIAEMETKLEKSKSVLENFSKTPVQSLRPNDDLILSEKYTAIEENYMKLHEDLNCANNKIVELKTSNQELVDKCESYERQINDLEAKILQLNLENDQLLSTVTELRSSVSSAVDQRGFEIAELWKQHLAQRENDFQKTEQELRAELAVAEAKYEQLLDSVQSTSQEETNKLVMTEQITSLQNKLEDKENLLRNYQNKYDDIVNQLEVLNLEMDDEKLMLENKVISQQEEYEKHIEELMKKIELNKSHHEAVVDKLQTELSASRVSNEELNQQIIELKIKLEDLESKVCNYENQLQLKESEIFQKTHEYTLSLEQRNEEFENVRKKLIEVEKKLEDATYEKEAELAVLRLKMHEEREHFTSKEIELEKEKTDLVEELSAKIVECTALNKQVTDLNNQLEEQTTKINEMQTALESQEFEIVTLKDEINSLQGMLRASTNKIEKHVSFASGTKPGSDHSADNELNKELLDAVPRAELDLALYMLHQRDVRCEELTMELTQLLEERDTLQIRLSDSLRSSEELKLKCSAAGLDVSSNSNQDTVPQMSSYSVEREQHFVDTHRRHGSRSSSFSDLDGDKLEAKLSEIRGVKQNRDVRLRQESEHRQLGMRLMQRDVANLPPEAVEQLTQAHHTLSRDSQSTSTVLLNWLRGKGTPKVVHM